MQTYDKDTKYYTIGFEDKTLESCQAKADDFRVLFDLQNSGGCVSSVMSGFRAQHPLYEEALLPTTAGVLVCMIVCKIR